MIAGSNHHRHAVQKDALPVETLVSGTSKMSDVFVVRAV